MRVLNLCGVFFIFCLCAVDLSVVHAQTPSMSAEPAILVGDWHGSLKIGAVELRVIFKVRQSSSGELTGTMDSVDQGAKDLPIDSVVLKDNTVHAEMKLIRGSFEGKLDPQKQSITGTW